MNRKKNRELRRRNSPLLAHSTLDTLWTDFSGNPRDIFRISELMLNKESSFLFSRGTSRGRFGRRYSKIKHPEGNPRIKISSVSGKKMIVGHNIANDNKCNTPVITLPELLLDQKYNIIRNQIIFKLVQKGIDSELINEINEFIEEKFLNHEIEIEYTIDLIFEALRMINNADLKLYSKAMDYLRQLEELFNKGIETFDTANRFKLWLGKPSYGLNGEIPWHLLRTTQGIQSVNEELERIEHGTTA